MVKISKEAALEYHEAARPGKIEVKPTKAYRTQTDLSLGLFSWCRLPLSGNPTEPRRRL